MSRVGNLETQSFPVLALNFLGDSQGGEIEEVDSICPLKESLPES